MNLKSVVIKSLILMVALLVCIQTAMAAGVTIITHGWNSGVDTWLDAMRREIENRAAAGSTRLITITIQAAGENNLGFQISESSYSPAEETFILIDWSDVDNHLADSYPQTTQAVAAEIAPILRQNYGSLVENPVHLIGHSRGGSLMCELARLLGNCGIWVDQVTTLDPRPLVNGHKKNEKAIFIDDAPLGTSCNVLFADNYYQDNNYLNVFDGKPVPGAYNRYLGYSAANLVDALPGGYEGNLDGGQHADVHLWYHGTIDTSDSCTDGSFSMTDDMRSTWYSNVVGHGEGWGACAGYFYSRIGGGDRLSPTDIPEGQNTIRSGYHNGEPFGGGGVRQPLTTTGSNMWPNLITFDIYKYGTELSPGKHTLAFGETLVFRCITQDQDSQYDLAFYADEDKNPYNGNSIRIAVENNIPSQTNYDDYRWISFPWQRASELANKKYIYGEVSDGTRTRYLYASQEFNFPGLDDPEEGDDFGYQSLWIEDLGDGDDIPEAGEEVTYKLGLHNLSSYAVDHVDATLSLVNNDPDVEILDNRCFYDVIESDATKEKEAFDVRLRFTETRSVLFNIHIEYQKDGRWYWTDHQVNPTFKADGVEGPVFQMTRTEFDETAIPGGANNNGAVEGGEWVYFHMYLQNTGTADAADVQAKLSNIRGNGISMDFEVCEHCYEDYPDLRAGDGPLREDSLWFDSFHAPRNFTGIVTADLTVIYGGGEIEQYVGQVVLCEVQPAPWIQTVPASYHFGTWGPDTNLVQPVTVVNVGAAAMQVTGYAVYDENGNPVGDTTLDGGAEPFPWVVLPGTAQTANFVVDTSALDGEAITRVIVFESTGRVYHGGEDDRFLLTGLISDQVTYSMVPTQSGTYSTSPDISGDWIVWCENRYGNNDIFAYNIESNEEVQVTSNISAQWSPKISGSLVAWVDDRNGDSIYLSDIYAYDLERPELGVMPVLTSSDDLSVIGVDGARIAITQVYAPLYKLDGSLDEEAYNLVVLDYDGNGSFSQSFSTGWTTGGSTATHETVSSYEGDFSGDLLVFIQKQYVWDPGTGSWGSWNYNDRHIAKVDFSRGDVAPIRVYTGGNSMLAASTSQIVFTEDYVDASGNEGQQVWRWVNGASPVHMTEPGTDEFNHAEENLALSSNFIVYEKDLPGFGPNPLMYWDLSANQGAYPEYLLTNQFQNTKLARMDDDAVVWQGREIGETIDRIYFAFLGADVSVVAGDIQVISAIPVEGVAFSVDVTVKNSSKYATSEDVVVILYDADPADGGTLLSDEQTIVGGIAARSQKTLTFENIILPEGTQDLVAVCSRIDGENPANNKATATITVLDSDPYPPNVRGFSTAEHNGDGDGYIEDDEYVIASWSLQDDSGISSVNCAVNDITSTVSGTYETIVGPLSAGSHKIEIVATDNDDSPTSMSPWMTHFTVYPHAPSIVSVIPLAWSEDVGVDETIQIVFDVPLSADSVIPAAFLLSELSGDVVDCDVNYDAAAKTVTLVPSTSFDYESSYNVTVLAEPSGVTDAKSDGLDTDYTWTFTTESEPVRVIGVPSLIDLDKATAQQKITAFELTLGTVSTQHSNSVPINCVISQTPAAGTLVLPGTSVDLVLSLGPVASEGEGEGEEDIVSVPNLFNLGQTDAQELLVAEGLILGVVTEQYSDTVPTGQVISQTPVSGSLVVLGSSVDLVVSLGPIPAEGEGEGEGPPTEGEGEGEGQPTDLSRYDVNGDGTGEPVIDAVDVQLVINDALGLGSGNANCDINDDGQINAVDVQLVINAALGLI